MQRYGSRLAVFISLICVSTYLSAVTISMTRSVSGEYLKGEQRIVRQSLTGPTVLIDPTNIGPAIDANWARIETAPADLLGVGSSSPGPAYAEAQVLENNFTYAGVAGQLNDTTTDKPHLLRGEVRQTLVGGNPFSSDIDLSYSFELKDMFFETWDLANVPRDSNPFAGPSLSIGGQIFYEVQRDGITLFKSRLDLWGGSDGFEIDFDKGLDGISTSGSRISSTFPIGSATGGPVGMISVPRRIEILDVSISDLALGRVSVGDTFEIVAIMSSTLSLPPFVLGVGGRVGIGDPNELSAATAIGMINITPVPVPGALWLLFSALASSLVWRRWFD